MHDVQTVSRGESGNWRSLGPRRANHATQRAVASVNVSLMRSGEETDDPVYADERDFYKVEKWTRDGTKVDSLLYAGNNLDKAREIFAAAVKHRPRIRLTIRRQARVLRRWPQR